MFIGSRETALYPLQVEFLSFLKSGSLSEREHSSVSQMLMTKTRIGEIKDLDPGTKAKGWSHSGMVFHRRCMMLTTAV